ncbi:uncharacterized protein FSUBG_13497 [Fusarium subglutinans]|uniref:Uncharacterized protein n=1 Tax=Gibberella subglutinans TaxID=42677 RepID=A0A8H5NX08_GIBSU|nr:uncharacterized protein FSUBG_13497 [Fusarium subglutinans]KAF5580058.1 hypothetical protein FSUBG_13497 [Fusarium subglutinans]
MSSRQPENERDYAEILASDGPDHVTPSLQVKKSAIQGKDTDNLLSPKDAEDGCGGKDYNSNGPKTQQENNLRSEMVGKPSPIEPIQSTSPRDPVIDTEDRPHQPLAMVESPGSGSLKPGPGPERLQLRPLNTRFRSARIGSTGPRDIPILWQKDRKE